MSLPVIGITGRTDRSARPPNLSLFAVTPTYVQAVELGGGAPVVIPPHLEEAKLRAIFEHLPTQVPDALPHSTVAGRPLPTVVHTVEVAADSRLAALVGAGELGVNSAHHQAVKVAGTGLVVTARAPDGVVEGLEAPGHPFCVGVQWHPEAMVESHPVMRRLFEGLVEAARAR